MPTLGYINYACPCQLCCYYEPHYMIPPIDCFLNDNHYGHNMAQVFSKLCKQPSRHVDSLSLVFLPLPVEDRRYGP